MSTCRYCEPGFHLVKRELQEEDAEISNDNACSVLNALVSLEFLNGLRQQLEGFFCRLYMSQSHGPCRWKPISKANIKAHTCNGITKHG